ncbi:hypothetical protein DMENIID0001_043460 [Sergentomyia squamirostris]
MRIEDVSRFPNPVEVRFLKLMEFVAEDEVILHMKALQFRDSCPSGHGYRSFGLISHSSLELLFKKS